MTTLRRSLSVLGVVLAACLALLGSTGMADAATRHGRTTIYSPQETKEMANWMADHGNLFGFTWQTVGSTCGGTCAVVNPAWLAFYKDTLNEAARTNDCIYVTRFAPGVGGDSAPYVGVGCDG